MSDPSTGLLNNEGFPHGQLQPAVSDPGLSAAQNSSEALPYPPASPSSYRHQAIANEAARDFNFVSGCRPIGGGLAQPISERYLDSLIIMADTELFYRSVETESLTCVWPNCSSKRTFKRTYELQRHMKKHTSLVRYPCTAVDCPSKRARTFYRLDKFRDHLRNSHGPDDLFACPVPACTTRPLPLLIFFIHAESHFPLTGNTESWCQALLAIRRYGRYNTLRLCPFEGCQKWLRWNSVQAHLLSHEPEDLMKCKAEIAEAGYDIPSGHLICPVCSQTSANYGEFEEHFTLHHLILDAEHYAAWRAGTCLAFPFGVPTRLPWTRWYIRGNQSYVMCPTCGLKDSISSDRFVTHHLGFLAPFDWINESLQKKVLNLWPAFATHPVFNSIRHQTR
jgi:hypothetical protein